MCGKYEVIKSFQDETVQYTLLYIYVLRYIFKIYLRRTTHIYIFLVLF